MDSHDFIAVHADAFSSGQISSKLWLCEKLEEAFLQRQVSAPVIWIVAGWYGLSSFLLLSRGRVTIRHIRSFDIDPKCQPVADALNENWVWQDWKFKAFTADCLNLDYTNTVYGPPPSVIINTSVEHLRDKSWWERIPRGTFVALQSCDMDHEDHSFRCLNLAEFAAQFPLTEIYFAGERRFTYPDWEFTRFMRIGIK